MKAPAVSERLSDALNPIVVKELRQAVQSRFVTAVLLLFLLLQVGVIGIYLIGTGIKGGMEKQAEISAGSEVFVILQAFLLGTCMLFMPAYAGVRLAAERSDVNVDLLFITTLKPRSIIAGKFLATMTLTVLIFCTCLPFLTFTYLLRGLDVPTIFMVVVLDFFVVAVSVQLAILVAAVPTNVIFKVVLALMLFGGLVIVFACSTSVAYELLRGGTSARDFWGWAAASAAAGLVFVGLFFVWSVALTTPASANRSLPVRLYMVGAWLASAAVFAALDLGFYAECPGLFWLCLQVVVFGLGLLVAVNEREQWGPRVARRIPRNWLLRLPAFVLYSGAAGGVLFCAAMLGLSFLALWGWERFVQSTWPGLTRKPWGPRFWEILGLISLYLFAYGLTAVLVRRVPAFRIRPGYTWIVVLGLLVGLCVLPLLFVFLVYIYPGRPYNEYYRWFLNDPIVAAGDSDHTHEFFLFAAGWAGLAFVLNLPWFWRQLRAFRPYAGTTPASALAGAALVVDGEETKVAARPPA